VYDEVDGDRFAYTRIWIYFHSCVFGQSCCLAILVVGRSFTVYSSYGVACLHLHLHPLHVYEGEGERICMTRNNLLGVYSIFIFIHGSWSH
jgi:hypothetical protein